MKTIFELFEMKIKIDNVYHDKNKDMDQTNNLLNLNLN